MVTRHVCIGLVLTALVLTSGCCHPLCRRPSAVVGSAPVTCPPGAPAIADPVPVPAYQPTAPPGQPYTPTAPPAQPYTPPPPAGSTLPR